MVHACEYLAGTRRNATQIISGSDFSHDLNYGLQQILKLLPVLGFDNVAEVACLLIIEFYLNG